jgi:hypothetical protein
MASTNVALMTGADCAWAANLMEHQREAHVSYSPVFWRTAEGAIYLHARFLDRQLARDDVVGFRTVGLDVWVIASPALSDGGPDRHRHHLAPHHPNPSRS